MKLNRLLTVSALALAGVAFTQIAASANVSTASGDIVFGFEDTSHGVTTDYELDLGNFSLYSTPGYTNSDIANINTDLGNIFGAGWAGNSTLAWSVVGTSGVSGPAAGRNVLYVGAPAGSSPTTTNGNTTATSNISQYVNALNGATSTATNAQGTAQFTISDANGFSTVLHQGNGYGMPSDGFFPEQNVTNTDGTIESTTLELYSLANTRNGTPVDIGTFTLNGATGVISFEAAGLAAPEPSTYALLGLGALALAFLQRRSIKA